VNSGKLLLRRTGVELTIVASVLAGCAGIQVEPTATTTSVAPTLTPTTLAACTPVPTVTLVAQAGHQQGYTFETEVVQGSGTRKVCLNYLLFLPKDYGADPQKKWPLILFLHGLGETGNDLEMVKKHGIPKIVEQQPDFPFITVSPQCPYRFCWPREADTLSALLDEVAATYAVDANRIYLTGLSMGGYGTWYLATEYPERFAAVVPIAGGGDPDKVCAQREVPVWAFHGAKDVVVPPEESEKMVNALKACDGDVQFTLYPDAYHDSWTQTYENSELYQWLLKHTLTESRGKLGPD
jgi:predicted peptidase